MPQSISRKRCVLVRNVGSPLLVLLLEIGLDLGSARVDQRPNDISNHRLHGYETFPSGTPEKIHQKRLDSIVARMRQRDLRKIMRTHQLGKKFFSLVASFSL